MLSFINIDTILSDRLLLIAAILLVVSVFVFLIAFVKMLTTRESSTYESPLFQDGGLSLASQPEESSAATDLAAPAEPESDAAPEPEPAKAPVAEAEAPHAPLPDAPLSPEEAALAGRPASRAPMPEAMDRTTVMPAGVAEVQGQLEIALTQIKTLNKKIAALEDSIAELRRSEGEPLQIAELKEPPQNPADYSVKLLKLAEHVIVLEREMARLKSSASGTAPVRPS